jgi:hypothetical protein
MLLRRFEDNEDHSTEFFNTHFDLWYLFTYSVIYIRRAQTDNIYQKFCYAID